MISDHWVVVEKLLGRGSLGVHIVQNKCKIITNRATLHLASPCPISFPFSHPKGSWTQVSAQNAKSHTEERWSDQHNMRNRTLSCLRRFSDVSRRDPHCHLPLELKTYFITFYIRKTTVSERINPHSCGVDIHCCLGACYVYAPAWFGSLAICAAPRKWDSQSAVQAA